MIETHGMSCLFQPVRLIARRPINSHPDAGDDPLRRVRDPIRSERLLKAVVEHALGHSGGY
jgi:hypothetical protein